MMNGDNGANWIAPDFFFECWNENKSIPNSGREVESIFFRQ